MDKCQKAGVSNTRSHTSRAIWASTADLWLFLKNKALLVVCSQWCKGRMAPVRMTKQFMIYFLVLLGKTNKVHHFLGLSVYLTFVFQNKINSLPFNTFFPSEKGLDLRYDPLDKGTAECWKESLLGNPWTQKQSWDNKLKKHLHLY